MVKTFPLDMMLSQGLGMAFSLARGEKEKERNILASVFFRAGLLFELTVAVGVAYVCYRMYPDWMLMYFADHEKVPKGIIAYIFSGYLAMYTFGFLVVNPLSRTRKSLPWGVFAALMAAILAFIGLTFRRLWYVGSYREYHRGNARPVTDTPLFYVLGGAMPAAVGGLILALRKLGGLSLD